jgi:hypothetical protein
MWSTNKKGENQAISILCLKQLSRCVKPVHIQKQERKLVKDHCLTQVFASKHRLVDLHICSFETQKKKIKRYGLPYKREQLEREVENNVLRHVQRCDVSPKGKLAELASQHLFL